MQQQAANKQANIKPLDPNHIRLSDFNGRPNNEMALNTTHTAKNNEHVVAIYGAPGTGKSHIINAIHGSRLTSENQPGRTHDDLVKVFKSANQNTTFVELSDTKVSKPYVQKLITDVQGSWLTRANRIIWCTEATTPSQLRKEVTSITDVRDQLPDNFQILINNHTAQPRDGAPANISEIKRMIGNYAPYILSTQYDDWIKQLQEAVKAGGR